MKNFAAGFPGWKIWLLGILIGGVLGGVLSLAIPTRYRAMAVVTVDFNVENTWPGNPDNEIFYFLDREARKLEELAWSDDTLMAVTQASGTNAVTLRGGILELSQPKDGGWHFYAYANDPKAAATLAASWAKSFNQQAQRSVVASVALDGARKALEKDPADQTYLARVTDLEAQAKGILPGIEISASQLDNLHVEQQGHPAWNILGGAMFGLLIALFLRSPNQEN